MPLARAARPCPMPGCPQLQPCADHHHDRRRPSAAARGYDQRWRHIRAAYLAGHPRCECDDCAHLAEADRPAAVDVDHRDGRGPRGDNSWHNLQAMAHGHHSRKTVLEDGGFGRG